MSTVPGPTTMPLGHLQRYAGLIGVEELPVVLGRDGRGGVVDADGVAQSAAEVDAALHRRGLLAAAGDGAAPAPCAPLAEQVAALCSAPDEVAVRRITGGGIARLCLAAGAQAAHPDGAIGAGAGSGCAAATRAPGDDAPVTLSWERSPHAGLMRFLGAAEPAALPGPVRVPLEELQRRLGGARPAAPDDAEAASRGECAAAFTACGVPPDAADVVASVLCSVTTWSEVVLLHRGRVREAQLRAPGPEASGLRSSALHDTVPPAAMVVYDSPLGRLAATPERTPGGVLWVTFGPGDTARIGRGLAALAALER
ncbi:ESX secretion-associated protein EspG [Tomitella gaofuii]|uniref:ESX secretion-associated protein EspG n=1 Tax=Tomitella gaofuii TaxID=2760083 RepID=UPI0015F9924A|nr:ESX secretion-associated protein EspG [Tomitella gaofuii]